MYEEGARFPGRYLVAVIRPSEGPLRVGITVSRKVGNACVRNLVKRRIREAVRQELDSTLFGWDVVLTARGQRENSGRSGIKGAEGAGGINKPAGDKVRVTAGKRGGARVAAPVCPSFSGIVEDMRRISGRLSDIKETPYKNGIKGKGR